MTEEEIKALQEAKEAAERRAAEVEAAAQAAKAEAEKAKTDLTNVVSELQEERRKKNEALSKATINNNETDVNSLIERALAEKELARKKAEVESAIAEFRNSKPEFQADSAGLVFGKFQETLKKFNLSDVESKEQARARLEEVYKFANLGSNQENTPEYVGTSNSSTNVPESNARSQKEIEELATKSGMSTDRVSTLKSKYPDAFGGLGI